MVTIPRVLSDMITFIGQFKYQYVVDYGHYVCDMTNIDISLTVYENIYKPRKNCLFKAWKIHTRHAELI